ncbi:unnamed protein product [Closterium sp. NIES-65]|nr:unnamed protein product [Closterium sp. NIES-65]
MDKYELRWGRVFTCQEEERPRHGLPVVPASREIGVVQGVTGGGRLGTPTNGAPWWRNTFHVHSDEHRHPRDEGVFRSQEGGGRRRDERGRWRAREGFSQVQGEGSDVRQVKQDLRAERTREESDKEDEQEYGDEPVYDDRQGYGSGRAHGDEPEYGGEQERGDEPEYGGK